MTGRFVEIRDGIVVIRMRGREYRRGRYFAFWRSNVFVKRLRRRMLLRVTGCELEEDDSPVYGIEHRRAQKLVSKE